MTIVVSGDFTTFESNVHYFVVKHCNTVFRQGVLSYEISGGVVKNY